MLYAIGQALVDATMIGIAWWASTRDDDWRDATDYDDWPLGQELLYPNPPDPNKEKKNRAEEKCFNRCESKLGGDRCGQGFDFTNCMKNCMSEYGFSYP